MTEERDPERIVDGADEPLRDMVTALRSHALPQPRVEAISVKLQARLAAGPKRSWATRTLLLAAALVIAGLAFAAIAGRSGLETPPPPTPTRQVESATLPAPPASTENVAPATASAAPAVVPSPTVATPTPRASASHAPVVDDTVDEDRIIGAARAKLATDPAGALALTEEHARKYPNGTLSQERDVLAIEALTKLGRRAEAQRRGTAFLTAYPVSAYRARVEQLMTSP